MKLVIRKEGQVVEEQEIQSNEFHIGRSRYNDLILQDPRISRNHAVIFFEAGQWYLEDLKSDNGTKIHGQKIAKVTIHSGDRFEIGPFLIELAVDLSSSLSAEAPPKTPSTISAKPTEEELPTYDFSDEKTKVTMSKDLGSEAFLEAISVENSETEQKSPPKERTPRLADAPESSTEIEDDSGNMQSETSTQDDGPKTTVLESQARLICLDEDHLGEEVTINKDQFIFGNNSDADVIVDDGDSKTRKATISLLDEKTFIIESNDHFTGTYVDGIPVEKKALENHDIIQIGDSKFEFVDEASHPNLQNPKVLERKTPRRKFDSDKYFTWPKMVAAGSVLGFIIGILIIPKPEKELATKETKQIENTEKSRLALFHLDQAQQLISEDKLSEAEARLRLILEQVSSTHPDALKLLKKIETLREEKRSELRKSRLGIAKKQTQIRTLLELGDNYVLEKNFEKALEQYKKANEIDPDNLESLAAMEHLEKVKEEEVRQQISKEKEQAQLKRMFQQGVKDFESGKYYSAKKLLREVEAKESPYKTPAKNILQEIRNKQNQEILSNVKLAREKKAAGNTDEAFKILSEIQKKYPRSKTIQKALGEVGGTLENQAKKIYQEGLTLLEVANDPAGALDQFQKVLNMAPVGSEYYKKAKEKIDQIQVGP